MPRLISARSRRKPGGATAITHLAVLAVLAGPILDLSLEFSRIIAGIVRKPGLRRNRELGGIPAIQDRYRRP